MWTTVGWTVLLLIGVGICLTSVGLFARAPTPRAHGLVTGYCLLGIGVVAIAIPKSIVGPPIATTLNTPLHQLAERTAVVIGMALSAPAIAFWGDLHRSRWPFNHNS